MKVFRTDNDNRLLISDNKDSYSCDGLFTIDPQNRLIFHLNQPEPWLKKYNFGDKITFVGNWKLNADYNLELELQKTESKSCDGTLILKGNIISLEGNKLVFELKSVDKNGLSHIRILNLSGGLNLDASNQIFFSVSKKGLPDILLFGAGWRINKNQQIAYTYQKTFLKTKTKARSEIVISGFWQITGPHQLSYSLTTGTDCRFDFKTALQTPNIYPKEGAMKYRVGIGMREERRKKTKIISLFGTWKLNRSLALSFEMEYLKGEIHSLKFDTEIAVDRNNRVIFELKGARKDDLGASVIFSHKFIKQLDAEVFLRLKHSLKESGVDAGVLFPF